MAREHIRVVDVEGKRYRITDFDALRGGFAFLFVAKKIIPLLKVMDADFADILKSGVADGFAKIIDAVLPVLDSISQEDLTKFMTLCLEQVEIELPAGYEKVVRGGEFTVDEVKYSTKLALVLCYHAIEGIVADFFGEKALDSLLSVVPKATKRSSR